MRFTNLFDIYKIKCIISLIIINLIFLGCRNTGASNISDEVTIKKHIDKSYEKIYEKYTKLCKRPRNDFYKNEFDKLRTDIAEILYISESLINFDYEKQKEISDYSGKKLKTYSVLHELYSDSKIACW